MRAHLIGICGTAMAGVATMLKEQGIEVQGSDSAAYPPMSELLRQRGIAVMMGYDRAHLATSPEVVVVGNVARRDNPEVVEAQRRGIELISMPQAIRRFFLREQTAVVVAGTHGKTTVTSLVAWLLTSAGRDPSFLVGGIPMNFGANCRLGSGRHFVIEGDEYDTAFFDKKAKFFHYNPTFAVITSLEFDHADIYPDMAALDATFGEFATIINPEGRVAWCADYPNLAPLVARSRAPACSYGFSAGAQVRIVGCDSDQQGTHLVLRDERGRRHRLTSRLWGRHNALNAAAGFAIARLIGLSGEEIRSGLASFEGVLRRFQAVIREGGITVIDDFAHHPTAVRETVAAARLRFPESRLLAAFHFESNSSRRKVFQEDYAEAFRGTDLVFLLKPLVKQDSLRPEDYLDPEAVAARIRGYAREATVCSSLDELATVLLTRLRPGDVLLAMSGRDFSPLYERLRESLRRRAGAAPAPATAAESRAG